MKRTHLFRYVAYVLVLMLLVPIGVWGKPASAATGDPVLINEVLASHSGTDDTEFAELFGTPGYSLNGLSLIVIEGDAFGPGAHRGGGAEEYALDLDLLKSVDGVKVAAALRERTGFVQGQPDADGNTLQGFLPVIGLSPELMTESELVQDKLWESAIGNVAGLEAEDKKKFLKRKELLHLGFREYNSGLHGDVTLRLEDATNEEWAGLIKRVRSGEIEADRYDTPARGVATPAASAPPSPPKEIPTKCPACGGKLPPLVKGMREIVCEYCDTSVRL